MSEKTISNVRVINKHDIEENWLKATNFTPKQGEIIVYDIDENYSYERIKIGDGVQNVNALPFADDTLRDYVDSAIATIPTPDVSGQIEAHNTSETAHSDIRTSVGDLKALVGDTSVSDQINDALLNNQPDWKQTDSTKPDYIKNKPDENDALELVSEMGLVEPILAEDGSVYTDENGVLYTLM